MEAKQFVSWKNREFLDKETILFYYEQANKQLEGILAAGEATKERGYQLLSIIIAILTGFSWVVQTQSENLSLLLASLTGIGICIFVSFILMKKVISVHTSWQPGKCPSEFEIDTFINYYRGIQVPSNRLFIHIVADQLETIETKIALNSEVVNERERFYGYCLDTCTIGITFIAIILASAPAFTLLADLFHLQF